MNQLQAGIARRDITPPLGTGIFGYAEERVGNVVADPLGATALVLRSGELTAAIISLDWGQIDEDETAEVRNAISAATGIAPLNITICASHTHSAPVTVNCWGWGIKNVEYLQMARPRIVDAVKDALDSLQDVRVGIGVTETETGINRREVSADGTVLLGFNPWGAYDSDLTVVRFEGESGTVAQIVHLGAHPTARGFDPEISRDWPGVMMDRVEQITGSLVLFINGAFGDVAPNTNIYGAVGDGAPAAREVGLRAASDAISAFKSIKEFRNLPLETLHGEFELKYAPLEPLEAALKKLEEYDGHEHTGGNETCEWQHWNAVRNAYAGTPQTGRPFEQTITRIGPIVIVPFSGEIFSEIALRLKKYSPFTHTLCAGTSNGGRGYFVTREARGRGGFEVWVARAYSAYYFADNLDDVLVAENLKLLNQLSAERGK